MLREKELLPKMAAITSHHLSEASERNMVVIIFGEYCIKGNKT